MVECKKTPDFRLTRTRLLVAGWSLQTTPHGRCVVSPRGDIVERNDILFIGADGDETPYFTGGVMALGQSLYRLLGG